MIQVFNKPEDVKPDYFYARLDDNVIAWNDENKKVYGHFAGINENGKALVFVDGKTSWTTNEFEIYENCVRKMNK